MRRWFTEPALRGQHPLDLLNDLVVIQEVAAPGCIAPALNGLRKLGIVLDHSCDGPLHGLIRAPAGPGGKVV